jgi:hypothetical protein
MILATTLAVCGSPASSQVLEERVGVVMPGGGADDGGGAGKLAVFTIASIAWG